jgi:hypothetical protein
MNAAVENMIAAEKASADGYYVTHCGEDYGENPSMAAFCRRWKVCTHLQGERAPLGVNWFRPGERYSSLQEAEREASRRNERDAGDWQDFLSC